MTIIAKGTEVSGVLMVEGDITIEGTVRGDITATKNVKVGETGLVMGTTIQSDTASIYGRVEGHLVALQHITLGKKATLLGDLQTGSLVIEEGAVFHGTSSMMEGEHNPNLEVAGAETVSD